MSETTYTIETNWGTYGVRADWGQASAPVERGTLDSDGWRWENTGRQVADYGHEPYDALLEWLNDGEDEPVNLDWDDVECDEEISEDDLRAALIAEVGDQAKNWEWNAESGTITAPGWYAMARGWPWSAAAGTTGRWRYTDGGHGYYECHYPEAESREEAAREYFAAGWGESDATVEVWTHQREWTLDANGQLDSEELEINAGILRRRKS